MIRTPFIIDGKIYAAPPRRRASPSELAQLSDVNRVNALAAIMSARHGWLGASFSCAEILTCIYFSKMDAPAGDTLILSKGHAAPMQYACLAADGGIAYQSLLTYKNPQGLQAHPDISTPGVTTNTGSLGQSLSKACGLALAARMRSGRRRLLPRRSFPTIYVILGDGELQEGQNYEALQTIKKYGLCEVVPVVDANRLQTDSAVKDIKDIGDIGKIFRAFGFETRSADGHDIASLQKCLPPPAAKPTAVVAYTTKGFGSSLTSMPPSAAPRSASWHSRVPTDEEYIEILSELVGRISVTAVSEAFAKFRVRRFSAALAPSSSASPPAGKSTRAAFAEKIFSLAVRNKKIIMLDADLEKSLGLTPFARKFPERFVEVGIAEQDMVSVAGGLALGGFIPVVNTYAAFLRRAYEQIYANATEKTPVIYAGNYSGLSYSTDGKSHQMTGDVSMMRAIPGMRVYDPFSEEELYALLEYYLSPSASVVAAPRLALRGSAQSEETVSEAAWDYPVYIKLRRSAAEIVSAPAPSVFRIKKYASPRPPVINRARELVRGGDVCLIPCGPQLTALSLSVAAEYPRRNFGVVASTAQNFLEEKYFCKMIGRYRKIIVLEENVAAGGFADEISAVLQRFAPGFLRRVIRLAPDGFTFSSRTPAAIYARFGLDEKGVLRAAEG